MAMMDSSYADDDADDGYRQVCERCRRARVVCVCSAVARVLDADGIGAPIRHSTKIFILQDRHEFRRALGSAVCCALALEKCEVKWHDVRDGGGAEVPIPGGTLKGLGVLWPDESAIDLDDYCAMENRAPLDCLIVLDTTWSRAKAMYYAIPWLARVPKYVINPRRRSNYRIRKQPKEYCLSTAECVAQALSTLEPESRAHLVADCFDGMIDDQLEAESRALRAPRMRDRTGSKALRRAQSDAAVGHGAFKHS